MAERRLRVLMAGPDPQGKGGMETAAALFIRYADADVRYVSTYRAGSAASRVLLWCTAWARIVAVLLLRRADVVHVHLSERISMVREGGIVVIAHLAKVPSVLHCHGAEFQASYAGLPSMARRLVRSMLARSTGFLVLGEGWRAIYAQLLDVPVERFSMLYNPVALPSPTDVRSSAGSTRVLFLGRIGRRKGSYDLVEAFAALPEPVREKAELRIAGDGDVDDLMAFCRSRGVPDSAVVGWLHGEQKEAELAAAEVFVLPSHDEGLPMALLEAMAWGLVPVVSAVGSMGEVVLHKQNGLIVKAGEPEGIAQALELILTDDALRATLAQSARRTAERFSVESYMVDIGHLWRRMVDDG
jgi:glycosyltransferase involved in cell wall biosynthesis